jgi:PAS domain S-box-containing protein
MSMLSRYERRKEGRPSAGSSLSTRLSVALVLVATVILVVYAVCMTSVYRDRELAKLEQRLAVTHNQLQTSLATALWNFDANQIEQVLDGAMKDPVLAGITLKARHDTYGRRRDASWRPVTGIPTPHIDELQLREQPIIYDGQQQGSLSIFVTRRFLKRELITGSLLFGGSILLLDLLLVWVLYQMLNRIVLDPLKKLQVHAQRLSDGEAGADTLNELAFSGEMEGLRTSLAKMVSLLDTRCEELRQETRRSGASEERFRILVNTIPDMIWLKDPNGTYLACNRTFERFFGSPAATIVGRTDYDFVAPELAARFRDGDTKAVHSGEQIRYEQLLTFADNGEKVWIETTKTPMYSADGAMLGVLGIGHDITRRKHASEEREKLEAQLQQAQKMESVGRLAGGVAHDFNNMLSVILGNCHLALQDLAPSDPLHARLEQIQKAGERSAELTRQLLAFARKQPIAPRPMDLNDAVLGMLGILRRLLGENVTLTLKPGPEPAWVLMDPSQLDQILANLCVNARDAIADVGEIAIEIANAEVDESFCSDHMEVIPGSYVRLSVTDNGSGIEPEVVPHVFEPFFTTKEIGEGTGLGLATVYGIVKQNKGFLTVYSVAGDGATFHVYLPRRHAAALPAEMGQPAAALEAGHETVLLVEDEVAILQIATDMLTTAGYRVLPAAGPKAALKIARECAERIDLLMTDLIMPDMNGVDLAERIHELQPQIKSLYMSGYTANVLNRHGADAGVQFLQKPFTMSALTRKVRETLDQPTDN